MPGYSCGTAPNAFLREQVLRPAIPRLRGVKRGFEWLDLRKYR